MNNRMMELAIQAGLKKPPASDVEYIGDFDWRTFGETIVKECARVAKTNQVEDMAWDIGEILLEHFGVETRGGWVCPKCGVDRTKEVCPSGYNSLLVGQCPMVGESQ